MGTNYYVRTPASCGGICSQHCKGEEIHLGKSSGGWAFTFRAYPEPSPVSGPEAITWPVVDFESWKRLLDLGDVFDEYGRFVEDADLLTLIEGKRGRLHHEPGRLHSSRDADGNDFIAAEFC